MKPEILALAAEAKARAAEIADAKAQRETGMRTERLRIAALNKPKQTRSLFTGGDAIARPTQVSQIRRGCVGVHCSHFLNDHQH